MALPTTDEFRSSKESAALWAQREGIGFSPERVPGAASRGRGTLVALYWLMG